MKFRIKSSHQTSSISFDDFEDNRTIVDLKNELENRLSNLKTRPFHLSLNGKDPLNESQTIRQSGLVNGDTIYILTESKSNVSIIDQPLTLDEVRDGQKYPVLIDRLMESNESKTDFDLIVVALHALMLESGFQMDAENNYDLNSARKSSTFYVIRYRHKLCEQERLRCSLAIMKTDTLVTIDGVVNSISQACGKLSFHIGTYLYTQKEAAARNCLYPYHDLRQLSRLFKDNLSNRLLCKLLEESGQRSSATLVGLPNEIKLRLAKYLPIRSLLDLQSTCRDIYNTFNDNLLWHDLCQRDFDKTAMNNMTNTIDSSSQEKNWMKIYRSLYTQKQLTLRHQAKSSSSVYHPAVFPLLPPNHPTHRVIFPDPTNGNPTGFHPFPPAIYRPIPPGIFRFCSANTQQTQTVQQPVQHHLHCQPYVGLKWVVIFAATTMIPFPPGFHHVWLG